MIPKIIHCVWLGGPKTKLALTCRASWARLASDWEVKEWSLAREGGDWRLKVAGRDAGPLALPVYVEAALKAKKWAFVSDWLRFVVLEREGGVYLDYDVELVRPLTEGLEDLGVANREWCALEWLKSGEKGYAPGAGLALEKGSAFARRMLSVYKAADFDGNTTVGDLMSLHDITPQGVEPEIFCPFDWEHNSLRTAKTIGIHHYALSWITPRRRIAKWFIWHKMGWLVNALLRLKK